MYLLPLDLGRWSQSPGGDLFVVPIWQDVRPLRGAAGLIDWRLNGRLSQSLREERFTGTPGEKLLLPTKRIPWRAILAVGLGPVGIVDDERSSGFLSVVFEVMTGLGMRTLAISLPGRENGTLDPAHAVMLLRQSLHNQSQVDAVTLVDNAAALKTMAELLGISTGTRAGLAVRHVAG